MKATPDDTLTSRAAEGQRLVEKHLEHRGDTGNLRDTLFDMMVALYALAFTERIQTTTLNMDAQAGLEALIRREHSA